ncbi:M28 family metallopeptidase [Zunongwangia sp.]|uniref:M28 family metallopeptidase n=1 Tax=Zunongwangia sp. TaxID=1965325 RepID=UPI003AA9E251
MTRFLVIAIALTSLLSCRKINSQSQVDLLQYAETITASELKEKVSIFASDKFEGRESGETGQKKAAEYLKNQYQSLQIKGPLKGSNYFQEVPSSYFLGSSKKSENVVAFIQGSENPEEVVVISSHYDHLGVDEKGNIFNGADDDASGTMAVIEIAEAFAEAVKDGNTPKRSILFLNNTGEEKGLVGSRYYTDNPIFPLENTVANLNIDMIGRIDKQHQNNQNYLYLIGSDKLSTELHELSEKINTKYVQLELDYTYNDENDPNRFYYRSDHYNFAKNDIPIIFYFNGTHPDYHKTTDTAEKLDYQLLAKRTKLIFLTAWEIANRENRLKVNNLSKFN